MKFSGEIIVNQPRDKVIELFLDETKLHHYQDGFQKKEHIKGEPHQNGSTSKVYYTSGKNNIELTETITNNSLPDVFEALYEHVHMDNTMKCTFTEIGPNETRYAYEFEYIRVAWVMPKLMFLLFPSMFRKQGEKWMTQFKAFADQQ